MMNALASLILAGLMATAGLGQEAPPGPASDAPPKAPESSPLFKLAERLGRVAGNADYCDIEEKQVEAFISNAMARLAAETEDRVTLAGSRVQFNAHAAYGRSKGPDSGCESFEPTFQRLAGALADDSPTGLPGDESGPSGSADPNSRFVR